MLSLWVGLEKVTELAKDQTLSFKLPSMVMGERVLRDVMEPEVVGGGGGGGGGTSDPLHWVGIGPNSASIVAVTSTTE